MSYDSWLAEPYEYPDRYAERDDSHDDDWEGAESDSRTWPKCEKCEKPVAFNWPESVTLCDACASPSRPGWDDRLTMNLFDQEVPF
jgi:hypothetical protein